MAHRSKFWILLIQLTGLVAWAEISEQRSLNVYVYNQVGVPAKVLSQAEGNTARIFRRSGLSASWINCATPASPGTNCNGLPQSADLIVQIVPTTAKLKTDVFGAAFLGADGTGQYSDVYYDRVSELHDVWNVPISDVLANVMAHEIGHLLLGLDSHSRSGIMRGLWDADQLKALVRGRLQFSPDQARLMRARRFGISAAADYGGH